MSENEVKDPRIDGIKTKIRVVPDFPKKGRFLSFFFFMFLLKNKK